MSNALAIVPRTVNEVVALIEHLSKATLVPKALIGKPADQLLVILTGQEMGLAPMAAMRGLFAIDGKVGMYADTMVALALSSGAAKYFRRVGEESAESVTYETMRSGDTAPRRCTWTKEMVKTAGLNTKENHRLYPRQLLASRAKSELARDVYPDVFAGVHTPEELSNGQAPLSPDLPIHAEQPAQDAEFTDVTEPPEFALIEAAATEADLRALSPQCKAMKNVAQKKEASARYQAKLAAFAQPVAEAAAS